MKPGLSPTTLLALALVAFAPRAAAMSVRPPTFPELVAEASMVARVRVADVSSRAVNSTDGRHTIKTFVTFENLRTLKGAPAAQFTLSFLGGEDSKRGERWTVPGMPAFHAGDEEFVFATAQASICPLVGAMHGRYRVLSDAATGRRYIARDDRAPLTTTDEVSRPIEHATATTAPAGRIAAALTPEQFEQRIAAEVARPTRPALQP